MNYARIINNVAVDVSADPESHFHPTIAAEFVAVPDDVTPGSTRNEAGVWTIYVAPPPPEPPEPTPRPALIITAITSSVPAFTEIEPDFSTVVCPVGTILTISAELRAGEHVVPFTSNFRMPVTSRDGRERVVLAPMVAGVATVVAPFAESGVWQVTEAEINSDLHPQLHMSFAGIRIFVVLA